MKVHSRPIASEPPFQPFAITIEFETEKEANDFAIAHTFATINVSTPNCNHDAIVSGVRVGLGKELNYESRRDDCLNAMLRWAKERSR